jgi:MerC mercury resistance protein
MKAAVVLCNKQTELRESQKLLKVKVLARSEILDRLGVAASCACAVHCFLMPLVISALPLLGLSFFADGRTEWAFVCLSMGLGLLSLLPGYLKHHKRRRPLIYFAAGICLILIARLLLEEDFRFETPVVVTGGLLVAAAHLINLKLCKVCRACPTDG